MKTHFKVLLILLLSGTLHAFAKDGDPAVVEDPASPKPNPVSTSAAPAPANSSAPAPSPPSTEPPLNPFEDVSLAGYCGQGKTLTVYLFSGKEKKRLTVFGDESPFKTRDISGFRVIDINRGTTLKTTSILLEKDGVQGTVMFNDDALRSPSSTAPQAGARNDATASVNSVPPPYTPRPSAPPIRYAPRQSSQPASGYQSGTGNYSSNYFIPEPPLYRQYMYPFAGPHCWSAVHSGPAFRAGYSCYGRVSYPAPFCRRAVFPCR